MVYGRYNELVNGVYKPTNKTGGHHPVACILEKLIWGCIMLYQTFSDVFRRK